MDELPDRPTLAARFGRLEVITLPQNSSLDDPLLEALHMFMSSAEFLEPFQRFFKENVDLFDNQFMAGRVEEHSLKYTECYGQYQELLEAKLSTSTPSFDSYRLTVSTSQQYSSSASACRRLIS
jgi:hypothetical protein